MEYHWKIKEKLVSINYKKYVLGIKPEVYGTAYLYPGIVPWLLHYGMF